MAISDLKRFMVPGALVIGGVTAGSMLAPVAFAAADDHTTDVTESTNTTASTDSADTESRGDGSGHGRRGHRGRHLASEVLTETLDMTADELKAAAAEGKTLADIAADQGVSLDDLKAALTAEAQDRIDQAVADERIDADRAAEMSDGLSDRIDELVNRVPGEGHGDKGDGAGRHGGADRGQRAEAMADFLGLSTDDLRAAFDDGQTLAEVAEAQGVSEADLVTFIVDGIEERLDQAVEDGRIDAAEADEKLADATERVEERINAEPGDRGGWGHGTRGDRTGK